MGTTAAADAKWAEVEAAARARGIDLATDEEARFCGGVLQDLAPRGPRGCPLRLGDLARALGHKPEVIEAAYLKWLDAGAGGRYAPETRTRHSDIGPPVFGAARAAAAEQTWGARNLVAIAFVVVVVVCLLLNLADRRRAEDASGPNLPPPAWARPQAGR